MLKEFALAIRDGNTSRVVAAISKGVSVNTKLRDGKYPLAHAVLFNHLSVVEILLKAGAKVNSQNPPNQDTALLLAAAREYDVIGKILLDAGADPNVENVLGFTPLLEAVRGRTENHLNLTCELIKAGSDVNAGKFYSILMIACASGSPDIVTTLIKAGAEVNAVRPRGTALSSAIEENRADNVAVLLAHKVDLNLLTPEESDYPGLTPLELAKKLKARKIIGLLEPAKGSAPATRRKPSKRPSVIALWDEIVASLMEHRPFIEKTLRKGATQGKLEQMETIFGQPLPTAFREFYQLHDGQKEGAKPLVPPGAYGEEGFRLLPIREIVGDWKRWKKLTDMGEFKGMKSGPDKGIRNDWWNPGWIPFADNGRGDSLCIDLAPESTGQSGQVISMYHESSKRELLARSLTDWMVDLLDFFKKEANST